MTDAVKAMLALLKDRGYRAARREDVLDASAEAAVFDNAFEREGALLAVMLAAEQPVLLPDDRFGFFRSQKNTPFYRLADGTESPVWVGGNITPNYAAVIGRGFDDIIKEIDGKLQAGAGDSAPFYRSIRHQLVCALQLAEDYRTAARQNGLTMLADALETVPHKPAGSFYEACVFFKILIFLLRCGRYTHLTIGRFDQYMLPYFEADRAKGISDEALFETLELFFLAINFDTDLYQGVQQGDNGQSMVLGGFDAEGNDLFNDLSRMCMEASRELQLIDPKINLRVSNKTPLSLYEYGTTLTKLGLGFPQYCNDDVVVPGLMALGYEKADALNYTVAACWEYIVPNCGADVPNLAVLNFPLAVSRAVSEQLMRCDSFEALLAAACEEVRKEARTQQELAKGIGFLPSPLLSLLVDGCLETGKDISQNTAKYNNSGCHGAGISNATDALAAIRQLIYEEKSLEKQELLDALAADFEGCTPLRNRLLAAPKMGNNEPEVDAIASALMAAFSDSMNNAPNGRGGLWRAGTGSAMEYLWSAARCPATADGKKAGEPYGSSFSPAITTRLNGPLSVIQSFTRYDMRRIINGGPLTMEVHDTVFRNPEGEKKVAQLVKLFIDLHGHQLQLNAVNRERLLDAQQHPEDYPNLIVRVWGWSGYFCELDKDYQDHIIRRTEFTV